MHQFSDAAEHGLATHRGEPSPPPLSNGSETTSERETTTEDEWAPATYRPRRRSETVKSVHHFPVEDVDEQGRLLRDGERGDGETTMRARKMGMGLQRMGSTVEPSRQSSAGGGESDSSSLEDPLTPVDEPVRDAAKEVFEDAFARDKVERGQVRTRDWIGVW